MELLSVANRPNVIGKLSGLSTLPHERLKPAILELIEMDEAAARQVWTATTASDPGSFFAMRACALLSDLQPFTPSGTLVISSPLQMKTGWRQQHGSRSRLESQM